MFGIGTWELLLILVLALIIVGPTKLPEVARTLGKNLAKLKRAADDVKREIDLDGLKADLTRELTEDTGIEELQKEMDLRGEVRQALSELEDPSPLPTDPSVVPMAPSGEEEAPGPPSDDPYGLREEPGAGAPPSSDVSGSQQDEPGIERSQTPGKK